MNLIVFFYRLQHNCCGIILSQDAMYEIAKMKTWTFKLLEINFTQEDR